LGFCRSQVFLLERRKWTEVLVNKAVVFDIIPCFMTGRIDWFAQLESGISASVDQGGNGTVAALGLGVFDSPPSRITSLSTYS